MSDPDQIETNDDLEESLANMSKITVLDSELNIKETKNMPGLATLYTDENHIYAVSQKEFNIFDHSLNKIGSYEKPGMFNKHMEDMIVHNGKAYIVDNIAYPVYLLKYDVKDVNDPELDEVISMTSVYPNLGQQWIEPDQNLWMFLKTTSGEFGTRKDIAITPMVDADTTTEKDLFSFHIDTVAPDDTVSPDQEFDVREDYEVDTERIYHSNPENHYYENQQLEEENVYIEDITSKPPIYAVIKKIENITRREEEGNYYISSIDIDKNTEDGNIKFGYEKKIDNLPKRITRSAENEIMVMTNDDNGKTNLLSYDIEEKNITGRQKIHVEDPLEMKAKYQPVNETR